MNYSYVLKRKKMDISAWKITLRNSVLKSLIDFLLGNYDFYNNVACASSSTVVWSVWRRNPTCWSRRTGTSSTWPSWTTTSTRRSPSWRPRSSASTRHPNGCPSLGSTDSGLHRFVISSPRIAMAHRGWNSDRWCHDDHRTTVDPLVTKIWRRRPPVASRSTPRVLLTCAQDVPNVPTNAPAASRLDDEKRSQVQDYTMTVCSWNPFHRCAIVIINRGRGDQRRVAAISTSMSIAATEASDHPETEDASSSRHDEDQWRSGDVRPETDAFFSRTTNSLLHLLLLLFRLPPSKFQKTKCKEKTPISLSCTRTVGNECVSLPSIPRDLSLLSTHSRHGFAYEFLTVPRPGQIDAYLCAVIRQRDNRHQRTPGRNVEN